MRVVFATVRSSNKFFFASLRLCVRNYRSSFRHWRSLNLRVKLLLAVFAVLSITNVAVAQNNAAALANLPEADALIYVSPQRILNEAAPRVVSSAELTKMRSEFAEIKKSVGIDPSTVEYIVLAVRFNKPAADLSFVAPDIMVVAGGDFSSESVMSLGQLYMQDKARVEKHGSKEIGRASCRERV